jgi:hypothetical protein
MKTETISTLLDQIWEFSSAKNKRISEINDEISKLQNEKEELYFKPELINSLKKLINIYNFSFNHNDSTLIIDLSSEFDVPKELNNRLIFELNKDKY